MKTLIEVDRRTWGKVKDVATVNAVPVGSAAGILLSYVLGIPVVADKKRLVISDITTQCDIIANSHEDIRNEIT